MSLLILTGKNTMAVQNSIGNAGTPAQTVRQLRGRGANNPNLMPTYESGYLLLGLDSFVRSAQNKQTNKPCMCI
jgi:hypothetical protein